MLGRFCFVLLLTLFCGKLYGSIDVELDVLFGDSTVNCRCMYVICIDDNDTIAAFDTLSFFGYDRASLFYRMNGDGKDKLILLYNDSVLVESNIFEVLARRAVFDVVIWRDKISVSAKDYLYPRKNNNKYSYFIYLLIFFAIKTLLTALYIFIIPLAKRNILIASGVFLISSLIDWSLPVHFFFRFVLTVALEYIMISLIGRKSITWGWSAVLVLLVNISGAGIIALLYFFFSFW